ncbi:MAG: ParB/RepB/Spo0J family partition protein [Alphaproteobacteria bacterium]|nr:ParB/RepB/Spo0J family partition protein [Alphaproteobacteria bacterium]
MTKSKPEKRGLGRGLSALMADINAPTVQETASDNVVLRQPDSLVPIEKLVPNPEQPRRDFVKANLDELATSIREKGIIQPLIVRQDPSSADKYQIVAGERRWRAAQMANLHEIPVLIRDLNDTEVIEYAIIENIQRADLNSVEEAQGYRQLMDKFGHTQEKLAEVLGKSRSHIANLLRLLTLPDEVLDYLREGKLSAGHARALVTAENPGELARQIISKRLSVRQAEKLAKSKAPKQESSNVIKQEKDADTVALELDLAANIGMKVTISHNAGTQTGSLIVSYASLDQLDELCQILTANTQT